VLVLGGALLSLLPGLPTVELDPKLILFLFLPPLVYSSAWQISWREFRASLRPILLLAIGLVPPNTWTEPSHRRLHREILQAERAAVIGLRDQGRIDDEVLREMELDLEEQRFREEG